MSPVPPSVLPVPQPEPSQQQWFAQEVYTHDGQLKAWLRATFPSARHEVDDVVQESYVRVWKRHAARPIESVKAFLFRAARNVAVDFLRHNKSSPFDPLSSLELSRVIDQTPDAADTLSTTEKYRLLMEAVAVLPPRCYEVVLWHKFRGFSQKEVALKLGISDRTVEAHVRVASKQCEAYLRARGVTSLHD